MDVRARLAELLKEQGLSRYRLAKKCDLPEETLTNIFSRGSTPTIATLEIICKGLNITLSQFFAEDNLAELTPELKEFYNEWQFLSSKQKNLILQLAKEMRNKN